MNVLFNFITSFTYMLVIVFYNNGMYILHEEDSFLILKKHSSKDCSSPTPTMQWHSNRNFVAKQKIVIYIILKFVFHSFLWTKEFKAQNSTFSLRNNKKKHIDNAKSKKRTTTVIKSRSVIMFHLFHIF